MSGIKACCQQDENLVVGTAVGGSTILRTCRVCGCRHFEVSLEPIKVHTEGAAL